MINLGRDDIASVAVAATGWQVHHATGKTFDLQFCTVARWKNGEIVEENLFYDQVGFVRHLGVL